MSLPRVICIVGTDTDVGKTIVTSGLLRALSAIGIRAQAIKPVQTGCNNVAGRRLSSDAAIYTAASPGTNVHTLHAFSKPCSPHLAALHQKKVIHAKTLAADTLHYAHNANVTLVEGSGGLFVPINAEETFLDLFALLGAPVVLVVANRLGAINHALLSLEALSS